MNRALISYKSPHRPSNSNNRNSEITLIELELPTQDQSLVLEGHHVPNSNNHNLEAF